MKDELRDELKEKAVNVLNDYIKEIADGRYGIGAYDIVDVADSILSLIGAERCVWIKLRFQDYKSGCGWPMLDYCYALNFCPCCGKRIEVKEVEDGQ
jgi:hypothetical protein